MCEQLYWNKNFIVGNVLENSIQEVWNSEKAKSIYFIKQEDIPSDSLCHTCTNFNVCREVRQVCYREIIKKYGTDKWYYPDVNCPYVKIKN
jgi:radical SAM protein with 4Fe4S-binding SPASM domain